MLKSHKHLPVKLLTGAVYAFAAAVLAILLGACASLTEHTVIVSQAQMQQKISAKTIAPMTVLKVFELQLTNPVVSLDVPQARIKVSLDALLKSSLLASKPLVGSAALSGKLRFDVASQSVRLVEPLLEGLHIDGLGTRNSELLAALAGKLGADYLDNYPLYTLKADDLKVLGMQFTPKQIAVTPQGLKVVLSAIK